jgi:phosphoribosylglycinamide formyltransferase 1
MRLGVLASGGGTTLQAVLDAQHAGVLDVDVRVVISNNGTSGALERARRAGVSAVHLSGRTHPDPDALDRAIVEALDAEDVGLVLLAGYMKKLGPVTLESYRGRILNTHPALLPKFGGQGMYGTHVHAAVIAAGETVSGVTIHMVDGEYDTGPILAQATVPVLAGDTSETLAARVQSRERALLVETLGQLASGQRRG